ncbi:MAG: AEC family transporter [Acidimicrobiia bacterium]|nr:AEC family transporter [Acidimicrobiia bacterium]
MTELAPIFVDILLPVFGLAGIGLLIGRRMDLDPAPLAKVAYYILAPAFFFDLLRDADVASEVVAQMAIVMGMTTVVVALLGLAAGRLFRWGYSITAATVLVAVYGNVGNFGIPIVAFAFGENSLPLAGISFLIINLAAFMIGVTAATWRTSSPGRAIFRALTTPTVAVLPIAMLFNVNEARLPVFADRAVTLLANAMIGVMLVTLGVQLARMQRPRFIKAVWISAGLRLLIAPAIAAAAAATIGLSGVPGGVTILQSGMPAAVFAALIAIEHDLEPDFVTTTVLVSTVASAFTLAAIIALL